MRKKTGYYIPFYSYNLREKKSIDSHFSLCMYFESTLSDKGLEFYNSRKKTFKAMFIREYT
jgi:hypothetical protein